MIRRLLPVVAATLMLAACGSEAPPQVEFAAGTGSVVARPTQYCDLEFTSCANDADAPVGLAVPAGTPLRIVVPGGIASTPWHVVFTYRSGSGEQVDGRSPLFGADQRSDYTLDLPQPTDRLLTAQVQQFGPPPQADAVTGAIEFPVRASWVLTATA